MEEREEFIKRLEAIIGERSLRSFAKKAEISDGALRQYLSGKSEPTRPVLIKLAIAGDVDLNWLATGVGFRFPSSFGLNSKALVTHIQNVFIENRRRGKGWLNDAVFLVGVNAAHEEQLESAAIKAATEDSRCYLIIDASEKNLRDISLEYTGNFSRENYVAYQHIENMVIKYEHVAIFKNISRSKVANKSSFIRSLVKILNDGRVGNYQPAGDLVFIDKLSFLEKSWDVIGEYVKTNVIT